MALAVGAARASLYRAQIGDEGRVADELVSAEISEAFVETRSFPLFADAGVLDLLRAGASSSRTRSRAFEIKNAIVDTVANGQQSVLHRLQYNTRLMSRIVSAIIFLHRALDDLGHRDLAQRRFVLVRERHGSPTLLHVDTETTAIAYVGVGPPSGEMPTIYLGLNTFDALVFDQRRGESALFEAFKSLLLIEERAIETGYSHIEPVEPDVVAAIEQLIDEVLRLRAHPELEDVPELEKLREFSEQTRKGVLRQLSATRPDHPSHLDHEQSMRAVRSLERLARQYKRSGDQEGLRQVFRLLVAASGHDIHEVRHRANVALERLLAPKPYDAPLAVSFINLRAGQTHTFELDLAGRRAGYVVRIFRNSTQHDFVCNEDLDYTDVPLQFDEKSDRFVASYTFHVPGHYDFVVYKQRGPNKTFEVVARRTCSGRINVIPDVRGEIILEVFPDIHGHTRLFWRDGRGHPGLVYNENGEVIRLGRFSDLTAHLEHLKARYQITALYLLGAQKRGTHREDWAPEATSPSPFSPMSLVEIEPSLGGERELRRLIRKAHAIGIKIILDVIPHINRHSDVLPDDCVVKCYDAGGRLVARAATDGRYGSWNDGKLLNYRKLEVWEWLRDSILTLIEEYDVDGIRFDSAHAVPIMMKKNNFPWFYGAKRTHEALVEGTIVLNDREDDHFITTGFYDAACRDTLANPLHTYLSLAIERKLKELKKSFFVNIAECYWGRERVLTRSGIVPYNSALFKICEEITHGKTDVREIYHLYDTYYASSLPPGTELLGILGNHDERRALNTFGERGLRAAVALTSLMSSMIMDYEGSAEGEGWKVFMDNIYVNWNSFEYASHRSLERFYAEWYAFHRANRGQGHLIWAGNNMVAGVMKPSENGIWLGAFNFSSSTQTATLQFDNPTLPIDDDACYQLIDPTYSPVTGFSSTFTGRELRVAKIVTVVPYTDRIKLLRLETVPTLAPFYDEFLRDSVERLCSIHDVSHFESNFAFREIAAHAQTCARFAAYVTCRLLPLFDENPAWELALKRSLFHLARLGWQSADVLSGYIDALGKHSDPALADLGRRLREQNERRPMVFVSAEAEPFSKSGGLANVVYELPRELVRLGEEVYVITPMYRHGDQKSLEEARQAIERYGITYTGVNVRFKILDADYEVGVHRGEVEGIEYFMLDHHELFDGLYWGYTGAERLRRRVGFARACAEVVCTFGLHANFYVTNDAFAGLLHGVVRDDPSYANNPNFAHASFLHVIHNGGWEYFDSYYRWESGFDLFSLFNLPDDKAGDFCDPVQPEKLNCMAAGIRLADRVITVSRSYAKQIEVACDGLEHILDDVEGINNAVGADFLARMRKRFEASGFVERNYPKLLERMASNDELQEMIERRYPEVLEGSRRCEQVESRSRRDVLVRVRNKLLVQMERGLDLDPNAVLFSMIHRVAQQKGFQLLLEASARIFVDLGYQGIIGGAVASFDRRGEELATGLGLLQSHYPGRVSVAIGYQDVSIPLLCSDVFLMPSLNEPGGISQLEAFACGCLVVARATGGLKDTVHPLRVRGRHVRGNGFLFADFNPRSFADAMARCAAFFAQADDTMRYRARENTRSSLPYWSQTACRYLETAYGMKEILRPS